MTIQMTTGAPGARILGLGSYRPRRRVTNDELAQVMDTNDEWIQARVGIAERRWASEDETLVEMAVAAGGKAIAASGLSPDEFDLVVLASASLRAPIPGIGPQVAHRLGIPRPGAFDLNAGCAGFCYALGVVADSIRAGSARNALVIGVERLTDVTDQTDRSTAVIFADGAGAAVVGASDEPGIGPVAWGSDGDQYSAIEIAAGRSTMTMAGQAVYRWATCGPMPGMGWRRLALARTTRSISSGARPLAAMALPPAAVAISTRVSSSSAQRRSAMPTRLWIHSSLVSMTWASSSLVTRRLGR